MPSSADSPADLPVDAVYKALATSHRPLALRRGNAVRYPAAVAPFAALDGTQPTAQALSDLAHLVTPGDELFLSLGTLSDRPAALPSSLLWRGTLPGLQMLFPADVPLPPAPPCGFPVETLSCTNAQEMLALIDIAYPGFFRPETCRMGRYFGLRDPYTGALIAMGGERFALYPWIEISGLCCHPDFRGQGLATALLHHLLTLHRDEHSLSFLHVATTNTRAIHLYGRLGFTSARTIYLHHLARPAGPALV